MSSDQSPLVDKEIKTTIFAVRTTIGQEKSVLQNIFNRLRVLNPFPDLKALMIAEELRGYVFIEAIHQRDVMITIAGLRHIKGKIVGSINLESISHVISPRKVTEILEEGDQVEIISGVFQNQRAQVIRMPKEGAREEVNLRLLNSDSAISIKIHGDFLKLVQKGEKHTEEYIIKDMSALEQPQTSIGENQGDDSESIISVSEGFAPKESGSEEDLFTFGEEPGDTSEVQEDLDIERKKKKKIETDDEDEEEDEWSKFTF
ncbi:transcription elongation factor Spt5 [Promethearchaeum syntrophicum]|uniref:Transcription elongation factor Spt5 n=1 Tax=Promethearchaeum syntrophicum TaxID=2594042 RepID=A0A5B9D8L2_9ARCH|nr:transcription elongation factor Spt5 [Candidatus Prometheoarchaeum syntrophicum]QEE15422.1 Transcription elongation factor Spt5 [Candidatus Prometheoarchaeum syntrophicum]